MNLIIVESPTKARTLSRFLPKEYQIEATLGHIRDLPKGEFGVDIDHDFMPKYVIPREKNKKIRELVEIAGKAEKVILATDPDREGEAIAWHTLNVISKKLKVSDLPHQRIVFHEITSEAIKEAIKNPQNIDMKLVDAQQARRILDRIVGYKLSPLLWSKLSRRWLSAGRVQSPAVRLIVEREREREKFEKRKYFTVEADFQSHTNSEATIHTILKAKDNQKYEQVLEHTLFDGKYTTAITTIESEEAAREIIADLNKPFTVSAVDKREIKRSPFPPFTTSSLQQEAGRRFGFSSKKSMQVAQKLYEEGFITYHRTDSLNLAEKFVQEAGNFIKTNFGSQYLPDKKRIYHTKSKVAQEAHEAVRPTDISLMGDALVKKSGFMNRDHVRMYTLIWKRALASQASDAVFDSTTIRITSRNNYRFETQGSVIKFDGFLCIYGRDNGEVILPDLSEGEELEMTKAGSTEHYSSPPPRYTESTLVKALEEKDIGRPSTYAPVISTIMERNYVVKENKKLLPTELGFLTTDFLVKYFPQILSLPFTAAMENSLDLIAGGKAEWIPTVRQFYLPFSENLEKTYQQAGKVKMTEEVLEEKCPKCGNPLVIRFGKFGKFIACTTYPKCDFTKQLVEKIDMQCPKCGGDIIVKKSRRGKTFYGCNNYPKCNFAAWKKEDIK